MVAKDKQKGKRYGMTLSELKDFTGRISFTKHLTLKRLISPNFNQNSLLKYCRSSGWTFINLCGTP